MSCWEVLGIAPTKNGSAIRDAYERQSKFADGEEGQRLRQAYEQAMEEAGQPPQASPQRQSPEKPQQPTPEATAPDPSSWQSEAQRKPLSAADQQVVREVAIQVRAMLNDSVRSQDVAIWRAILTEPPADEDRIRAAIGDELEAMLRPLAEQASLPAPVARFLGDWFGWYGMTDALERQRQEDELTLDEAGKYSGPHGFPRTDSDVSGDQDPDAADEPKTGNFWPAVIGWIVGIVILTSLFGGLVGGGG